MLDRICEWLHVLNPSHAAATCGVALDRQYFEGAVRNLKRVLASHLQTLSPETLLECYAKIEVFRALRALGRTSTRAADGWQVDGGVEFLAGPLLAVEDLYCAEVNRDFAVLKQDFMWMRSLPAAQEGVLWCFLDFPFLISLRHKAELLRLESAVRMRLEAQVRLRCAS